MASKTRAPGDFPKWENLSASALSQTDQSFVSYARTADFPSMSERLASDASAGAATKAADILIVRHGRGRGRPNPYPDLVQAHAAATDPALARRIRFHATGDALPALDGVGVVWFALADPLEQSFPECYAEAKMIADEAHDVGASVINDPDALSRTAKSEQLAVWRAAGVPCARAVRADNPAALERVIAETSYPAILRADLGHTQETAALCYTAEDALRHARQVHFPAVMIEFIDVRAAWRAVDPDALFARFVHKKRSMIYRNDVVNNHALFSGDAICGMSASTFQAATNPITRFFLGKTALNETIEADYAYAMAQPEQPELMARAVSALGLDIAAIDYSTMPDGSAVLWEANPYFYMHTVEKAVLSKPRRIAERNGRYDAAMLRLLAAAAA